MKDDPMTFPAPGTTSNERQCLDRQLFNAIAALYCRKDLLPASCLARRHRLEQTFNVLPERPSPNVLEVGCGAGFSASYLTGHYATFVGIDYAQQLVAYARQYNSAHNVTFECVNIKDFQSNDGFDVVFMIGVLHHLDGIDATMQKIVTLLKPGGWIVVNEPQPANPLIRLARLFRKIVDRHYSSDQVSLSYAALLRIFRRAALVDIRIVPQGIFSTPFAEVSLPFQRLMKALSAGACALDATLEKGLSHLLGPWSWNLVAVGRKPEAPGQTAS